MATATHDAGVQVLCAGCQEMVLQKAMIPMLADGGPGIGYRCPPCARALIVPPMVVTNGEGDREVEEPDGSSS